LKIEYLRYPAFFKKTEFHLVESGWIILVRRFLGGFVIFNLSSFMTIKYHSFINIDNKLSKSFD